MEKCNKYPYPSRREAQTHLHVIINKAQRGKKPIRSYKCGMCGNWHLTSQAIRNKSLNQKNGKFKNKLD